MLANQKKNLSKYEIRYIEKKIIKIFEMVKNVFEVRKKCPFCKSKNFQVIFQKNFDSPDIIKFFRSHLNKNFPIKILKNEKYIVLECKRCSEFSKKYFK